jgi:Tetratricopeptide repeat
MSLSIRLITSQTSRVQQRKPSIFLNIKRIAIQLLCGVLLFTSGATFAASDESEMEAVTRAIIGGDLSTALKMLRRMEQTAPENAGGLLDVAMLYCEAGQSDDAERVFQLLETKYAPPPAIQQLIDYTRQLGCARPPPRRWSVNYGISTGYTDNVNAGPSQSTIRLPDAAPVRELTLLPSYLARSDTFIGLDAAGEVELGGDKAVTLIGGLRARQYMSESQFSYQQLLAGVSARQLIGQQMWDGLLAGSALMLGGHLYETALNAQAGFWGEATERQGRPVRFGVDVLASVLQYPQNPSYDAMLLELRGKSQWRLRDDTSALGAAGLVADLSRRDRIGGDRAGLMFSIRTETRLNDARQLNLHLQQYMLNDATIYNETLFGDLKRSPTSGFFSVRVQQKLNLRDSVYIQITRNWRDDTIPLFMMSSTVLLVGYQW